MKFISCLSSSHLFLLVGDLRLRTITARVSQQARLGEVLLLIALRFPPGVQLAAQRGEAGGVVRFASEIALLGRIGSEVVKLFGRAGVVAIQNGGGLRVSLATVSQVEKKARDRPANISSRVGAHIGAA